MMPPLRKFEELLKHPNACRHERLRRLCLECRESAERFARVVFHQVIPRVNEVVRSFNQAAENWGRATEDWNRAIRERSVPLEEILRVPELPEPEGTCPSCGYTAKVSEFDLAGNICPKCKRS